MPRKKSTTSSPPLTAPSHRTFVLMPVETPAGDPAQRKLASTSIMSELQDPTEVKKLKVRPNVTTGKPKRLAKVASMRLGYSGTGLGTTNTAGASFGNFYSPELSTDFLELPQSRAEQWAYYRFFYENNPFVGQAIDLHTELPLSKIRINIPKARDREIALAATRFCETWARRIKLLHRLISIVHEYHLIGEVFIFAEDANPDMPEDLLFERVAILDENEDGSEVLREERRPKEQNDQAVAWLRKNYLGWTDIQCLPPEQVKMEAFNFTKEKLFEMVPDAKTRRAVQMAEQGDVQMQRVVGSMPPDVIAAVREGRNIPLGTDPDAGSFVYYMANKKSDYAERGHSILGRCLLPGMPVTILLDGYVVDLPVEQVVAMSQPLLLTHAGRFMPAVGGSRPVSEHVVVIACEGDVEGEHLVLTREHRVLVVRSDGKEDWVEAQHLLPGDLLRESHPLIIGDEPCMRPEQACDLVAWWRDRTLTLDRRARVNHLGEDTPSDRVVAVVESVEDGADLVVTFSHAQDDVNRLHAVEVDRKVVKWLSSLREPTAATSAAVGALLGLTRNEVDCSVTRFRRDVPGFTLTTEGRTRVWHPLQPGALVPGEKVLRTERSSLTHFPIDADAMYLLGAWVGDGCTWKTRGGYLNTRYVVWSCGDQALRMRIFTQVQRLGSAQVGHIIATDDTEAVEQVWIEDPLLARWFHDQFGHEADQKRIPAWVFALPPDLILAFLRGMLDTDGSVAVSDNATCVQLELDNRQLVNQVHLLCSRVGFHTTVSKHDRKAREWTRIWKVKGGTRTRTYQYEEKTFWRLTCSRHEDVRQWAEGTVKGARVSAWPDRMYAWTSRFTAGGFLTRRISSVLRVPYSGPVFSFDVEQDFSMVASKKVVHNCLQTLVHWDKLRQANASIASRHMTPIRVVWAADMDAADTDALREQVDLALQDPDFSIIANFEINWNEMGSDQRLLDLTAELDMANRELYAGLGVTEGLLTGESSYSGDKISLEVINTRYMLLRELLQDFVEEYLFKPMCCRMGFVEIDEDGNEVVIYPKLSFTRLALRDTADTFDILLNLYQKGSLDVDTILELMNIDPVSTREKLVQGLFTTDDALFNEALRSIYGEVGRTLADPNVTDVAQKISDSLRLKYTKPKGEQGGRF